MNSTKPKATHTNKTAMNRFNQYNLYFTLERALILHNRGAAPTTNALSATSDDVTNVIELPPMPKRYQQLTLPHDWYIPNKFKKELKRRPHRKSHGVVSFREMAKIIATNWKSVDHEVLNYVNDITNILKAHYELGTFGEVPSDNNSESDKKDKCLEKKQNNEAVAVASSTQAMCNDVEPKQEREVVEVPPQSDVVSNGSCLATNESSASPDRIISVENMFFNRNEVAKSLMIDEQQMKRLHLSTESLHGMPRSLNASDVTPQSDVASNGSFFATNESSASPERIISVENTFFSRNEVVENLMLEQHLQQLAFSSHINEQQEQPKRVSLCGLPRSLNTSPETVRHPQGRRFSLESSGWFETKVPMACLPVAHSAPVNATFEMRRDQSSFVVSPELLSVFQRKALTGQYSEATSEAGLVDINDTAIEQMWHTA